MTLSFYRIILLIGLLIFSVQCKMSPLGDDTHLPVGGSGDYEDQTSPTDPSSLSISGRGTSSQTKVLSWAASTDNIIIDHYQVSLGTTGSGAGQTDLVDWVSVGTSLNYQFVNGIDGVTLSGLTSGTLYYISVKALDAAGNESEVVTLPYSYFVPTDYSNLSVWLDASDQSTLFTDGGCSVGVSSDGDTVNCWQDKSGNGVHFTQNSGAPTYLASAINSFPGINFPNSARHETPDTGFINTGNFTTRTHFIVFRTDSDVTTRQQLFKEGGGTNGAAFYIEGGVLYVGIYNDNGAVRTYGTMAVAADTNYISGFVFDAASNSFTITLNGTANTQVGLGASVAWKSHSGDVNIGAGDGSIRIANGSSVAITNTVSTQSEYLIYSSALDASEQEVIEGYFACKWGMQSSLPGSHAYSSLCP